MKIEFYDIGLVNDKELKFAVISAIYKDNWVYVKHKNRNSWEIPGGHRESGETIDETAKRELFEETGSKKADLLPICDYSIQNDSGKKNFGRLFFARIQEIGKLPVSEIDEVKLFENVPLSLTYLETQPKLFEKTLAFIKDCDDLLWESRGRF